MIEDTEHCSIRIQDKPEDAETLKGSSDGEGEDNDDNDPLGGYFVPQRSDWNIQSSTYSHFTTAEGKTIRLVKGNIAKQTADVIVNTIERTCDLTRGAISRSILQVAGADLQDNINNETGGPIKEGDLIITSGGYLNCKAVFHICTLGTQWNDGIAASKMCSIAIPAMGTGNLGYPRDVVARMLYDEVKKFSIQEPGSTLSEVKVVVYDKDQPTCQAFEDEMARLHGKRPAHEKLGITLTSKPSVTSTTPLGTTSFKTAEGKVVKLVKGSIANQQVDVILNTTSTECDLSTGVVSQAILKAAGVQLQGDINQNKPPTVSEGDVVVTGGANLNCKYIYHVCILGTKWDGGATVEPILRTVLQTCFQKAHHSSMSSIALPALGTGGLNYPRDRVAKIIYEEVSSFIVAPPTSSPVASIAGNSYKTAEGKTITLVKGNIVTEQADVIVNPIETKCSLGTGVLSQAMLKVAGDKLQTELTKINRTQ
ncbi:protein mono-ADP-ribosyltransferase PARP14-like [Ptychodera flava]|uniref:protein mono-ADP-ribosyltransferase PARP14-like n=1 Tax=Ptychodera flava TaxID=63121 RepID=UPI00396A46D9